jgi:oligopeptide transport system ATP-binding protein
MNDAIIEVRNLVVTIPIRKGLFSRKVGEKNILNGVNFRLDKGDIMGCVGESGSGKTVLLQSIVGLLKPTSGEITIEGKTLSKATPQELKAIRRNISLIFQDPVGSLNRRMKVDEIVAEALEIHGVGDAQSRKTRVREVLKFVGLDPNMAERYPHQFSGGQRQRIGIARALAISPRVILADEPVSALDVSLAAQVINLFLDLKEEFDLTYFIVAHNMAVLRQLCNKLCVIYAGRLVESGLSNEIYVTPQHPYTHMLLEASPSIQKSLKGGEGMHVPRGESPDPARLPVGCPFHLRCDYAFEKCKREVPPEKHLSATHTVQCHVFPC